MNTLQLCKLHMDRISVWCRSGYIETYSFVLEFCSSDDRLFLPNDDKPLDLGSEIQVAEDIFQRDSSLVAEGGLGEDERVFSDTRGWGTRREMKERGGIVLIIARPTESVWPSVLWCHAAVRGWVPAGWRLVCGCRLGDDWYVGAWIIQLKNFCLPTFLFVILIPTHYTVVLYAGIVNMSRDHKDILLLSHWSSWAHKLTVTHLLLNCLARACMVGQTSFHWLSGYTRLAWGRG